MTEPTPGTTADGREPIAATPGTTADGSTLTDQDRQELERLKAQKDQWLGEKSKYEQAQAELEAARARIEAMQSPPPTTQPVDPIAADVQEGYTNLLIKAANGDPDARFQLAMIQGQQQALARAHREAQLMALPEDERREVLSVLQSVPALDVGVARAIADGERAKRRLKELETRDAEAKRIAEEQTRTSNAGVASVRTAPTQPQNGQMKASHFRAQMEVLTAKARDGDLNAKREARELGRKVDTGEIPLVYDE